MIVHQRYTSTEQRSAHVQGSNRPARVYVLYRMNSVPSTYCNAVPTVYKNVCPVCVGRHSCVERHSRPRFARECGRPYFAIGITSSNYFGYWAPLGSIAPLFHEHWDGHLYTTCLVAWGCYLPSRTAQIFHPLHSIVSTRRHELLRVITGHAFVFSTP